MTTSTEIKADKSFPGVILVVTTCVLFLLVIQPSGLYSQQSLAAEFMGTYYHAFAEKLYHSRELPGNLEMAVQFYKKAARELKGRQNLAWKVARCYWILASRTDNNEKRSEYFREGIRNGRLAVQTDPQDPNGHAWLSLVEGSSAMEQGVVKTLYNREAIKSGLETAIRLNPQLTNAYIGLATWYFYVPAFLGGDQQKAFTLIDRAIALEPNYTTPRLIKAEFLVKDQNDLQAVQTLKGMLAISHPVVRDVSVKNLRKAKKMLAKINSHASQN